MTIATPCDACGRALHRDVVALRFATVPTGGAGAASRSGSSTRRAYLVCTDCAAYVQACIAVLEQRASAGPVVAGAVAP